MSREIFSFFQKMYWLFFRKCDIIDINEQSIKFLLKMTILIDCVSNNDKEGAVFVAENSKIKSGEKRPPIGSWPLKLRQVPISSPSFNGCELVIAADCAAFAHGSFAEFTRGRTLVIGCTKFDGIDYTEKLTRIFSRNAVGSVHVVRMEAPCCGVLVMTVRRAIELSGKEIPMEVSVISTDGRVNR